MCKYTFFTTSATFILSELEAYFMTMLGFNMGNIFSFRYRDMLTFVADFFTAAELYVIEATIYCVAFASPNFFAGLKGLMRVLKV